MRIEAGMASSWLATVRFISSQFMQTATHLETFETFWQECLLLTKDLQDRFLQVSKYNALSSRTQLPLVMLTDDADVMCWRLSRDGIRSERLERRELGLISILAMAQPSKFERLEWISYQLLSLCRTPGLTRGRLDHGDLEIRMGTKSVRRKAFNWDGEWWKVDRWDGMNLRSGDEKMGGKVKWMCALYDPNCR